MLIVEAHHCLLNIKLWPNGEFTVGRKKIKTGSDVPTVYGRGYQAALRKLGYDAATKDGRPTNDFVEKCMSPLGLSNVPNSPSGSERAPNGSKGITGYGKRMVRNAALLLERSTEKGTVSFFTGTLPGLPKELELDVAAHWGDIIKTFNKRLSRHLVAGGLPGEIVGVTEIQENRLVGGRCVIGLHYHCAVVGRTRRSTWVLKPHDYADFWKESVCIHVPGASRSLWGTATRVETVRKSVAGYLGKYMSKGCTVLSALSDEARAVLPKSWWTCSLSLRRKVKGAIATGDEVVSHVMKLIEDKDESVSFRKIYWQVPGGGEWFMGIVGWLKS